MSTRFLTLLQREWMQHHFGWLLVMLVPPALVLLILPFGSMDVPDRVPTSVVAAIALAGTSVTVFGLSWAVSMFQLPGLARRDSQDRSIEFWLSLPGSHTESIGATLLAHALLAPLLALVVGAGAGLVMAAAAVVKLAGIGALLQVSWGSLLVVGTAGLLRAALGVLLFSLWLAPIMLALMAASAWLKRWGTPVLIAGTIALGVVLDKAYGNPIVWMLLKAQMEGANRAFIDANRTLGQMHDEPNLTADFVSKAVHWAANDALSALGQLASPHLLGGLLIAASGFGLLILARARSH